VHPDLVERMKRMTQQDPTVSARQIADPRRGVSQRHVVGHAARAVGPVVTPRSGWCRGEQGPLPGAHRYRPVVTCL